MIPDTDKASPITARTRNLPHHPPGLVGTAPYRSISAVINSMPAAIAVPLTYWITI
ncbi:MAG: hypothetical protein HF976_03740 [ANME-2 cluster archaeon]|nr:hypothetical protein [ANME-2 cluster archaeon]MBC2700517.1 hypothetical protein [ANME-2 cluster archaeon]MBC2706539.1 hypothetical protein [ANME-2 cluster archaeon]MBC2746637.1 hypothetical protein [ANME-2 cluster archaeon]